MLFIVLLILVVEWRLMIVVLFDVIVCLFVIVMIVFLCRFSIYLKLLGKLWNIGSLVEFGLLKIWLIFML